MACGAGERVAAGEWSGTIEERDGVTYVRNPGKGLWEGQEPAPVSFEHEQTFGVDQEPEEAILSASWRLHVAVDSDSNVYIADEQANRLVSFAPDGAVRWIAGRKGEGPAELSNPDSIVWDGARTLLVMNQNRTRVDRWSVDGTHLGSHRLEELNVRWPTLVGFLQPAMLVLSQPIWGAMGTRISLVSIEGNWKVGSEESIDLAPELKVPPGVSSGPGVAVSGQRILVGDSTAYGWREYGSDLRLQRIVTRDVSYPVRPGFFEEEGTWLSGFGVVGPPMILPSGLRLVFVSWADGVEDPDDLALRRHRFQRWAQQTGSHRELPPELARPWFASLDLFDDQGRFLASLVTEEGGHLEMGALLLLGPDGALYTKTNDPFPQVRRYRVITDP